MDKGTYQKHSREFWVEKWNSIQGENNFQTLKSMHPGHKRLYSDGKDIKEKWEKMIQEGKSPKEMWISHMEEMSKDGHAFNFGPFAKPEIKSKWEEMNKEGKGVEFWENYWNDENNLNFGPRFINPHEMQKRWEEMQSNGKTPEEFWKEEKEEFKGNMKGFFRRHHWRGNRFDDKNCEGEMNNDDRYNEGSRRRFWGHRHCRFWGRQQQQKERDEENLFKEFDF